MNVAVVGKGLLPEESHHGRDCADYYLSEALEQYGHVEDLTTRCDIAVSIDQPPPDLGQVRDYRWITRPPSDCSELRRWRGDGAGKVIVAASVYLKRLLLQAHVDVRCVIPVGVRDDFRDCPSDPELRTRVYTVAGDDDLAAHALVMAGDSVSTLQWTKIVATPHNQMPRAVADYGILLHLPREEAGGLCVREAMVAGRAVVSNTCGALDEIATWKSCGGDPEAAAQEIVRLASNERAWKEAAGRCARRARGWAWTEVARAWARLF